MLIIKIFYIFNYKYEYYLIERNKFKYNLRKGSDKSEKWGRNFKGVTFENK